MSFDTGPVVAGRPEVVGELGFPGRAAVTVRGRPADEVAERADFPGAVVEHWGSLA
ncbi:MULTISPECIES: hypothetical protein [unclassified Modestobacter]